MAQTNGRITETELQICRLIRTSDRGRPELRRTPRKSSELVERNVAAMDQLTRIDIRAPQGGTVHQLAIHTVGGVAAAGET
jgi:HlyD family secretion protein